MRPRDSMDGHPMSGVSTTLQLSVYILTFLIGVPANILAFCAFCHKVRRKPTPVDVLLLNLTVSDLIFLTFLPFKMKEALDGMVWSMPYFLCPLSSFLFYSPIYASTLFLTAVSVERYVCVAFPIKYRGRRRIAYTVTASVAFWVAALAQCTVIFAVEFYHDTNATSSNSTQLRPLVVGNLTCYGHFNPAQQRILLPVRLGAFLALFLVPLLICCFCYVNFIRILSRLPHIGRKRRLRAIGLALGTLLVFALCFGPYNMSHAVGFIQGTSPTWRNEATLLTALNACLDPVIFYCTSWEARRPLRYCVNGFLGILGRIRIL